MSSLLVEIAIAIIAIVVVIFTVIGLIAFWRFRKSYTLTIEKDYRNPQASRKKFYAIYNYKKKYYELFTNLLAFSAERAIANVDLKAYVDSYGKVRCVRSPTGKPGDDMIVPIGLPITGQADAAETADKFSNAIIGVFQKAGIAHEKLSDLKKLGTLSDEEVRKMFSENTIKEFKTAFTSDWVLKTVGLKPIQDASIITIPQKNAIASLNTRANEFVIDHSGWWEQHGGLVIGLMTIMFMVVGISIMMYGAQSYLTHLGASVPGIIQSAYNASLTNAQHSLNIYGINLSKEVPVTT